MTPLETLGFTLGTSFASGLNLYLTVVAMGLLQRFGVLDLPASLQVLASPIVLGIAGLMFLVEFVADKVPVVDSAWDAIHTFIRPPAAAILAYSAFGDVDPTWQIGAGLLAGGVALTSHGAKATTRAAANASPEPVSNWLLSFGEDAIVIGLSWMASEHPIATAIVVLVLVVLAVLLMRALFKYFRRVLERVRRFGREPVGVG